MNRVVTRYPLPVRLGAVLVCMIFAASIAKGPVGNGTVIVAVGAACLSVAILAYRAEIDEAEVRVRYVPFLTRRTQSSAERTLLVSWEGGSVPLEKHWHPPAKQPPHKLLYGSTRQSSQKKLPIMLKNSRSSRWILENHSPTKLATWEKTTASVW